MGKKISKARRKQWQALLKGMEEKWESLESAQSRYLFKVAELEVELAEAWAAVVKEVDAYQDNLRETADLLDEIVDDKRNHADDRSEQWHESEAGEQYAEWIDAMEELRMSIQEQADHIDDDPEIEHEGTEAEPMAEEAGCLPLSPDEV